MKRKYDSINARRATYNRFIPVMFPVIVIRILFPVFIVSTIEITRSKNIKVTTKKPLYIIETMFDNAMC